ncbi:DUF302 domain-containing protein [Enteractinococcus helveticum]|uniref:ABC transporter n=1 Tax=Enteractinococcus helveticum TaxID=1837282 RepID=A0A1B7M1K2_9MICC|nr:DUF302 domain-containing protein [Enteractinococcus helveticum]OAV62451.1 ABC transporter [Enteractinococcus helveticum]
MTYTHTMTVDLSYDETVARTRKALAAQGFGVLTEIDIPATFETKLGPEAAADIGDYIILGACNPTLAQQALTADPAMGALLPCNVVIRRAPEAKVTTIQALDPQTMVQLSNTPAVTEVAKDAEQRLQAALTALKTL